MYRRHPTTTAPKRKPGTRLTFSADELVALAQYVAAGSVLLRTHHPVLGKLQGAFTRSGLARPAGFAAPTARPRRGRPPHRRAAAYNSST